MTSSLRFARKLTTRSELITYLMELVLSKLSGLWQQDAFDANIAALLEARACFANALIRPIRYL